MASSHHISVLDVESPIDLENTNETNITICGDDNGVCLTWQDLCVTVSDKEAKFTKNILQDVTGYACPGQVLAIMGPSGCGKSTLLDALAGKTLKSSVLCFLKGPISHIYGTMKLLRASLKAKKNN